MRCPICAAEGRRHRLTETRIPPIRAAKVERFYDENDKLHVHDHEVRTFVYQCSNGHGFQHDTMSRCTHPPCQWNMQPLVEAGVKGFEKVYAEQRQRVAERAGDSE